MPRRKKQELDNNLNPSDEFDSDDNNIKYKQKDKSMKNLDEDFLLKQNKKTKKENKEMKKKLEEFESKLKQYDSLFDKSAFETKNKLEELNIIKPEKVETLPPPPPLIRQNATSQIAPAVADPYLEKIKKKLGYK